MYLRHSCSDSSLPLSQSSWPSQMARCGTHWVELMHGNSSPQCPWGSLVDVASSRRWRNKTWLSFSSSKSPMCERVWEIIIMIFLFFIIIIIHYILKKTSIYGRIYLTLILITDIIWTQPAYNSWELNHCLVRDLLNGPSTVRSPGPVLICWQRWYTKCQWARRLILIAYSPSERTYSCRIPRPWLLSCKQLSCHTNPPNEMQTNCADFSPSHFQCIHGGTKHPLTNKTLSFFLKISGLKE